MHTATINDSADAMIGNEIKGYRIISLLGEGAMGKVYYAEHELIGRRAAIKVLTNHAGTTKDAISRFFTEARSVNGIRHPNIVDITDFGNSGDVYYIIMELLEGETLDGRLDRVGRLDDVTTVRIASQIASALAAAHDKKIVHRDLKPENIFLCNHPDYPDDVRVLDFGIAKLIGETEQPQHKTKTGTVLGTPLYMSPEQCLGDVGLDHRSDIYSLGTVLYRMLTGVTPFDGEAIGRIIMGHISEQPVAPREHCSEISEAMNELVLRALAKKADDRFHDMREMRAALLALLVLQNSEPAPSPERQPAVASELEPTTFKRTSKPKPPPPPPRSGTRAWVAPTPSLRGRGGDAAPVTQASQECVESVRFEVSKIIMERIESNRLVLPAMPAVAMECISALRDPSVTFQSLASTLERDPLLVPQVLARANSAALRGAGQIDTLGHAISRLGLKMLKTVLVELSAHKVFKSRNTGIWNAFRGIWEHSLAVARGCREVVAITRGELDREVAYLAGLLHDVGKPVIGSLMLEAEKMLTADQKAWMSDEVWMEILVGSHRQVGEAVSGHWALAEEISSAIRTSAEYEDDAPMSYRNIVCFTNALAKSYGIAAGPCDEKACIAIADQGQRLLGLSAEQAGHIVAAMQEVVADDDEAGDDSR